LLISFWCLLSLVSLVFHARITNWLPLILANMAACILVCFVAYADRNRSSRTLRWAHDWAPLALVVFTYKQVYFMVRPIHQWKDYDRLLMALDRWVFRINPAEWLAGFAHPWLTEVLQIAYSLFYVFFIVIGLELYIKKEPSFFRHFCFTVVYGFFISYIGYFFLPAVGPRFTLHSFSKIDIELPGVLLTPALRWFVNSWESIPAGVSSAVALAKAQRDVFPSGHTMMTIVVVSLAYKYGLKVRHWVCGVGVLLVLATVYLRYHYLIDLFAGALLALLCLATSRKVFKIVGGRQRAVGSKKPSVASSWKKILLPTEDCRLTTKSAASVR
jgi:membrane-associated phospholipid phosphatase